MGRKKKTYDTRVKYDYETFYRQLCLAQGREKISDKEVGAIIGVSERQVRNARFDGMDAYQADLFCWGGLDVHPMTVYGWDAWMTPEAYFAAQVSGQVEEGENKVSLEEIDLFILDQLEDDEPEYETVLVGGELLPEDFENAEDVAFVPISGVTLDDRFDLEAVEPWDDQEGYQGGPRYI